MPYWIPAGLLIGLAIGLVTTGVMIRVPYVTETLECYKHPRTERKVRW